MQGDIGIAQINYRWYKENFSSVEEMLKPQTNIEYAGKLLASLFRQHVNWHEVLCRYHSATPYH